MTRLIGIGVMAIAAIAIGYNSAAKVKGRVEELIYVRRLMTIFQGELRYKNAMLADAFAAVAVKANGVYRQLFQTLATATEENYSLTMLQVFSCNIDKILVGHTLLNAEDIRKLKELGDTMGYQDQKMQLANVDLYMARLSESIEEDRIRMKDTMKMYRTLGVMGAFISAIVFI